MFMTRWNTNVPPAEYLKGQGPAAPSQIKTVELDSIIREVGDQTHVAIDTETTGLSNWACYPLYASMAWGKRRVAMHASVLPWFKKLFARRDITWLLANAKFDMHMLANLGTPLMGIIHCTQVMHSLLFQEVSHKLKDMARQLLGYTWSDFQDTFGRISTKKGITAEDVIRKAEVEDMALLIEYACMDAWGTLELYWILKRMLKEAQTYSLYHSTYPYIQTLWDYFYKVEAPYTRVLWDTERAGILIDMERVAEIEPMVKKDMAEFHRKLCKEAGFILKVNSTPQLRHLFYSEPVIDEKGNEVPPHIDEKGKLVGGGMGLTPIKLTDGGKKGIRLPSTDASVLEKLAEEHLVADLILKFRDRQKLQSTYIDNIHRYIDPSGRIHTTYNQDIARTGRLSSKEPNCFSGDTEVLTEQGWVRFDALLEGLKVAQWDRGVVELVHPTGYIKQRSKVLRIKLTQVDLKVTHNHRCLLRHRKSGKLRVFRAEDYPEGWQQLHTGHYTGGGLGISYALMCLVIATQADGSWVNSALDFGFTKRRKINRLAQLLAQEGIVYRRTKSKRRTRFYVPPCPQLDKVKELIGQEKTFKSWILQLDQDQLELFGEEVFFWDGCWTRKNHYASKEEVNADWVQTVLALTGNRARKRRYVNSQGSVSHQVDVTRRDYSLTTNRKLKEDRKEQDVYCVEVPSGYLLVRRKGCVVVTGNCQNIPNPENDKWCIRGVFIAPDDYVLLVIDYKQLEMRLLACASNDKDMLGVFQRDWDIHMGNASLMYGVPYDDIVEAKRIDKLVKAKDVPPEQLTEYMAQCLSYRYDVKSIGFGLNYGLGTHKLAIQLGCSLEEAEVKKKQYLKTYPAVSAFYESAKAETRDKGYAYTVLGRRRALPEINSSNGALRSSGARKAVNTRIQGSAADVVKMAQLACSIANLEYRFGCRMLLQIHDELVFECPKETAKEVMAEIVEWMEHPFPTDLAIPMSVDAGMGRSWAEGH